MIVFACHVCRTSLTVDDSQGGQLVRCPTCMSAVKAPAAEPAMAGVGAVSKLAAARAPAPSTNPSRPSAETMRAWNAPAATRSAGKRYGFNCPYCSSRLEATDAMAAQDGQCPTCGNQITIPILDRYGRLIDPKTRQILRQDPHPVHAYAAAGDRAPRIFRSGDGKQTIQCPRCKAVSPITANNCKSCGMPFTMEGTTLEAAGNSNGYCVASLVLGIIGLPAGCTVITPVLAVVLGIVGLNQLGKSPESGGGRGMAIAGILCGLLGCLVGAHELHMF